VTLGLEPWALLLTGSTGHKFREQRPLTQQWHKGKKEHRPCRRDVGHDS
jgi:hypothetical protein